MTKMPERGGQDALNDKIPQVMSEEIRWEPYAPSNEIQSEIEIQFNDVIILPPQERNRKMTHQKYDVEQ